MNIVNKIDRFLNESSTDDAANTLKAAIKFYKKLMSNDPNKKTKEVYDYLLSLSKWERENGSFSPDQAKAIYNISMGIKKMTGK
jgi:hypothetical protein